MASATAGLVPYSVPLVPLRAFVGSRDPSLCMKLETLFKREIADNASLQRQAITDGAPTLDVALRHLCMGDVASRGHGAQYIYALELLCAHFGTKLRNGAVFPVDDEWLMRVVDPVFDAWGLGDVMKLKKLIYGRWPVRVPHADFPRGGTLEADEVARSLDVMRRGALPRFDREVIGVISDVRGWLESAAGAHLGLVCFYY
ncbi:MAG TPA: hypothetical protein VIA18_22670 [Polyangia bacterium]|jgi:hypothetical protein|nr:hypothetical protein [Polyangia bacterium]HWE30844.1 hypothetical protein [Polyangia bacterium]